MTKVGMRESPEEQKLRAIIPVTKIPTDQAGDNPEEGIALCLSGGGYRAMLFHLGVLWRLNELGYFPRIERISSVSGGSITAAVLGVNWVRLDFDSSSGVARRFEEFVVNRVRGLASMTIDLPAIFGGIFGIGSIAQRITEMYRKHLYGNKTLQDLCERPRFVINATNVQSNVLWRFSRPYMWDYRVGKIENPRTEIAVAVAASAAFPPVLSPVILKHHESDYTPGSGLDLQRPPFTTQVILSDGGVYDNLGLETAWKRYKTILISDAGGRTEAVSRPKRDWLRHLFRVFFLVDNQVRSLRKRQAIGSYVAGLRKGAYWGVYSDIANYELPDALPCPFDKTSKLAALPTRLKRLDTQTQERLINWGYAICDAAIRKHLDPSHHAPQGFPYPDAGVG